MRRLRTGVLGCGLIAQVMHLPYLRELAERFEVTALCDLSPNARAAAGSLFPDTASSNARPTSSASRSTSLWCSRPAATPPVALAAIEAGLHVFVEKPLGSTGQKAADA